MQFGIFTVGDVTPDPTTGRTPTEHERIKAMVAIAQKAEEVGLDVFATGEHHNPPFVPSSPTTMLGYIAAQTRALHAVDRDDADHHQRPGEDRRGLRDAAAPGRRPGRPDDGPRQHRPGLPVVRPGHPQRHPAGDRELRAAAPALARGRRRLGGQVPHAAAGLHLDAAPAGRRPAVRLARLDPQPARSPSRPRTTATASSHNHIFWPTEHTQRMVELYRQRFEHYGHGSADQAIVGLGGQVFMRKNSPGRGARVPAVLRQRPGLRPRPVAGGVHRARRR